MNKAITSIASFRPCSVLIVRPETHMDSLFPKSKIFHVHAEQLSNAKTAFFKQETQETIAKTCGVSIGLFAHMNALDEHPKVLLSNRWQKTLWLLELQLHTLNGRRSSTGMS